MADDADIAFEITSEHVSRGLSAIDADIPAGVKGECEECGETMPRLVNGLCGFCRDGRRPPLSFFDRASPPAPAPVPAPTPPITQEEPTMTVTNTPDKHTISVPATGIALAAIRERAARDNLPLGQATISLLEEALATIWTQSEPRDVDSVEIALANAPDALLAEEVARRLTSGPGSDDYNSAVARADAAEAKLASRKALLT